MWNGPEALIAFNAPPAQRGRITGIYQTALGAVLAAGPFVPGVLPLSPDALTLLAVGLLVSGWLMTAGTGVGALRASHAGAASSSLVAAIRQAPALVLLACAASAGAATLMALRLAQQLR